ncbi:RICIN domain-containing protein [Streptomyces sp. NPDC015125]|uniref:RICIN domain-containing protein n=1 Tax=Streptomyces sp. NPDC015125 TaxID=3364938 RepID=UPI003701F1AE
MTVEMTPRSPGPRMTAAVLAVPVAALGIALSPLHTVAAHADTGSTAAEIPVSISTSAQNGSLALRWGNEYAGGTTYDLWNKDDSAQQKFKIVPNDDGTFRLVNGNSSKCLDLSSATYPDDLSESGCGDTDAQKWYLQPVSGAAADAGTYLIRHVGDNKCMKPLHSVGAASMVGARDCSRGDATQNWALAAGTEDAQLRTLATVYALKQFDDKSSVIPMADYTVDDSTTATLGDFQNVTTEGGRVMNGTSDIMDKQVNWSQTTGYTYTAGGSVTTTAGVTFGPKDGPVQGKVDVAIQGNWSNSWRTDNTQGGSATIHVKPNQYGWFLRAQLTKKVTGTWTITNDLGNSWTGVGSATVPAKEGTDSKTSDLIGCSSDSALQVCKDHDPGRA